MHVLFISPQLPYKAAPHGGAVHLYGLLSGLARRGVDVYLLSRAALEEYPHRADLEAAGVIVHLFRKPTNRLLQAANLVRHWPSNPGNIFYYFDPTLLRAARRLIQERDFDVVQFEYTSGGIYLPHLRHGSKILTEHDVSFRALESTLERLRGPQRWAEALRAQILKRFELQICREARHILVRSEDDRQALLAGGIETPVTIAPVGVDVGPPRRVASQHPPRVLFIGDLRRPANVSAVDILLLEILPSVRSVMLEVEAVIIGRGPVRQAWLTQPGVRFPGYVPSLEPYWEEASVFVAPITQAAGMKVKILEAMAAGVAVVTTPFGAEGLGLRHGENVLIGQDARSLAKLTVELLRSPELMCSLGDNGREHMRQHFGWDSIIDRLLRVYEEVSAG